MSTFLSGGGVECGPTNVLKNVGGRLERDYSLHQDRLVSTPNVAGPSSQAFRSVPQPQATRNGVKHRHAQSPFDLSSLRQHLSPPPPPAAAVRQAPFADHGWANAFVPHEQARVAGAVNGKQRVDSPWQADFAAQQSHQSLQTRIRPVDQSPYAQQAPWQQAQGLNHHLPPPFFPAQPFHPAYSLPHSPAPQYYEQYTQVRPTTAPPEQTHSQSEPLTAPQDHLAQTAQAFVDDSDELVRQNPKLGQSRFMELLRGLGKGEVVVQDGEAVSTDGDVVGDGATFVERAISKQDWAGDFLGQSTGQARLGDPTLSHTSVMPSAEMTWDQQFSDQAALLMSDQRPTTQRRKSVHFSDQSQPTVQSAPSHDRPHHVDPSIRGASSQWEESLADDADFDLEAFEQFNGPMRSEQVPRIGVGALEGWGDLQKDWDDFQWGEASQGKEALSGQERYMFHSGNPYAGVFRSSEGEAASKGANLQRMDSPTIKGLLELEAAVQADPSSREAWFALGLKQQENEREDQAIRALVKAVELDPEYRDAHLALAVSWTNEGEIERAGRSIERWIELAPMGGEAVSAESEAESMSWTEKREQLINRLIGMARRDPEQVEAGVQIALGVLFHWSEEYAKAEDCFIAALEARPDDWLLYNRLGATLANSGRSQEAITYYHKALSLHPNFVRALFNLGISYDNLGMYREAAQSILEALRLQAGEDSEVSLGNPGRARFGKKGVGSEVLWNVLRNACSHMGRGDLVELVAKRDLNGFPMDLQRGEEMQAA